MKLIEPERGRVRLPVLFRFMCFCLLSAEKVRLFNRDCGRSADFVHSPLRARNGSGSKLRGVGFAKWRSALCVICVGFRYRTVRAIWNMVAIRCKTLLPECLRYAFQSCRPKVWADDLSSRFQQTAFGAQVPASLDHHQ